jgi:Tol biopolymer transport system component
VGLAPGTRLAAYEVVSLLGAGGMGEVYRARDSKLNRDVALKILPEAFALDDDRIARFRREAQVLAALNHPNIAHIYGFEDSGGTHALVLELVDGPTLADCIAKGPIPLDEALPIAKQIAEALEAAHEQGIIHRDLKPANIKVRDDGTVKVLDFGLAKALEPASTSSPLLTNSPTITTPAQMTGLGTILGTAAYMSPEQASGKPIDRRADIWSFGVVVWEMLTGIRLFNGETVSHTLADVLRAEIDFARLPPTTPGAVRDLLCRCLDRDSRRRLRDVGDARLTIEDTLSGRVTDKGPTPARQGALASWRRALPWGVAIACVVALGAALTMWAPWRTEIHTAKPLQRFNVDFGAEVDISNAPGAGSRIALSPDGSRMVHMSNRRLFVRKMDHGELTELKGAEGGNAPFFSPDGKWIGFIANGKLLKVPAEGGSPTIICDAGGGGTWGDDGTIVTVLQDRTGLLRVPATGGTPTRLTKLEAGEAMHSWPQSLPGGKAVLFTSNGATNDGFNNATIEVVTVNDGRRKVIQHGGTFGRYVPPAEAHGTGHLIFAHEGTLFAVAFDVNALEERGVPVPVIQNISTGSGGAAQFALSRDGTLMYEPGGVRGIETELRWLDLSGKPQPLALKTGNYRSARLSPDGQKIALLLTTTGGQTDLWTYDWQRDVTTRLTFDGLSRRFVWSPDGRSIVFGGQTGMLWTRADGGSKPQLLTQSNNPQQPRSFTPDGTRLAFTETSGGSGGQSGDIWIMPVEHSGAGLRGGKPEAFLQTPFNEGQATFSPDGRWLAYVSNEAGGDSDGVYVRAFPDNGGKWQVSNLGGEPRWSRDGRNLFFIDGEQRTILAVNSATNGGTFAADRAHVWIPRQNEGIQDYDITPDGKRALVLQRRGSATSSPSQVILLVNFVDELTRVAPATK